MSITGGFGKLWELLQWEAVGSFGRLWKALVYALEGFARLWKAWEGFGRLWGFWEAIAASVRLCKALDALEGFGLWQVCKALGSFGVNMVCPLPGLWINQVPSVLVCKYVSIFHV